ncbi:hypothetical protein Cfor_12058 [Coptotermes formosanus]|uniref:Uncharacterized protein n=1 Tax=Coptotermes formosanus TaxID=36987 RepID=A0A6L2PQU3_COPFO|nr:hypothetical protein Cfor_12058 [Coptotermes formosanus]
MAVLAVLMLAMITVETLAKPVPGDWNHEINFGQDTQHPELQFHQNTESDDFEQIQHQHLQHVGQNHEPEDFEQSHSERQDIEQVGHQHQDMQQVGHNQEFEDFEQNQNEQDIEQAGHQQVGHNQEFEDFEQNQNEQQDIEQVGHQQVGHNQEFEDFEQNKNEQQDIEQVGHQQDGHNQEFEDFEQNQNEQQDIEQVGHQQVGHNQEFEDFEQNQNEQQDIEQVGHQQVGHNQEFEDFEQHHNEQSGQFHRIPYEQEYHQVGLNEDSKHLNYEKPGQQAYDQQTPYNDNEIIQLLGSDKYSGQQHDQRPAVEPIIPRQHYEEVDIEYVTTEKPRWWKKLGHKISDTYNTAKKKAQDFFG